MEESPMILRVDVKPELLRWARKRAGIEPDALVQSFPLYKEWESGDKQPTLKQLEKLAKVTRAPIGSFFLSQPLEERVPIPDLRTIGDRPISRPSVDLLDTVYPLPTTPELVPGLRSHGGRRTAALRRVGHSGVRCRIYC